MLYELLKSFVVPFFSRTTTGLKDDFSRDVDETEDVTLSDFFDEEVDVDFFEEQVKDDFSWDVDETEDETLSDFFDEEVDVDFFEERLDVDFVEEVSSSTTDFSCSSEGIFITDSGNTQ